MRKSISCIYSIIGRWTFINTNHRIVMNGHCMLFVAAAAAAVAASGGIISQNQYWFRCSSPRNRLIVHLLLWPIQRSLFCWFILQLGFRFDGIFLASFVKNFTLFLLLAFIDNVLSERRQKKNCECFFSLCTFLSFSLSLSLSICSSSVACLAWNSIRPIFVETSETNAFTRAYKRFCARCSHSIQSHSYFNFRTRSHGTRTKYTHTNTGWQKRHICRKTGKTTQKEDTKYEEKKKSGNNKCSQAR